MVRGCCILVLLSCLQLTLAQASTPSPVSKTSSDTDPSEDLDGAQNEDQAEQSWLSNLFSSRELRSDRDNLFWATRGKRAAMDSDTDFWAIRGKKQTIMPSGLFQHFRDWNQRELRGTPQPKRAGLKPNGLFGSIKRGHIKPNGLFNAYKRGGLKPNGLFGAYKRPSLKPNGLFGAFKRSTMR